MIEEAIIREGVDPTQLTIHADRGTSMTSKTVAQLYSDLGVTKIFSRPHVSDDNPFSEAQFKTLKYGPHFPPHFANIEHGRVHCGRFFPWYNNEHRHSGIALLTPGDVLFGRAQTRTDARRDILRAAWEAHPERFVLGMPQPPALAPAIFFNPPEAA